MTTMKAVVFDEIGDPVRVLKLAERPVPAIGDGEVLVKMIAASINPGDFLFVQNLYPEPKKPVFPRQIGGIYGAGIVVQAGATNNGRGMVSTGPYDAGVAGVVGGMKAASSLLGSLSSK